MFKKLKKLNTYKFGKITIQLLPPKIIWNI